MSNNVFYTAWLLFQILVLDARLGYYTKALHTVGHFHQDSVSLTFKIIQLREKIRLLQRQLPAFLQSPGTNTNNCK